MTSPSTTTTQTSRAGLLSTLSPPRKLCSQCQNIFDSWHEIVEDEDETRFQHHENIFALQESAQNGCPLCVQFLQNIENRLEANALRDATIESLNKGLFIRAGRIRVVSISRVMSRGKDLEDCKLLELRFGVRDTEDEPGTGKTVERVEDDWEEEGFADTYTDPRYIDFTCKVFMTPATDVANTEKYDVLSSTTKDALTLAKEWLRRCGGKHDACFISQLSAPTRLLAVKGNTIRLILSSSLDTIPRYATLSHCWGTLKILKLTTRNINFFQTGIPLELLCKTFQEAIHTTRFLGFDYLWIDSLCIIQDDSEDWAKESRLMATVYGSSRVNLAATSASNGNDGLFFNRDQSHVWRHIVSTCVDGKQKNYTCIEDGIYDTCLFRTPLAERAWVLQERLLAPRTIHFASEQIFWECNSLNACEVFPHKFPENLTFGDFYFHKQPVSLSLWPTIVQLYSTCKLSYERDKLVAIGGIARQIYNRDPANGYFAGIWRHDMEEQLCWKVRSPTPYSNHIRRGSWSWASIEGVIHYATPVRRKLYIKVRDVEVVLIDLLGDSFGEVIAGDLFLNCEILIFGRFLFSGADVTHPLILVEDVSYPIKISLDAFQDLKDPVFLLPVSQVKAPGSDYVRGLLLRYRGEPGCYVRSGYFEYELSIFEKLCQAANYPRKADTFDSSFFKEKNTILVS